MFLTSLNPLECSSGIKNKIKSRMSLNTISKEGSKNGSKFKNIRLFIKTLYKINKNYIIYLIKIFNKFEYLYHFYSYHGHSYYEDSLWLLGEQKSFLRGFISFCFEFVG